MKKFFPIATLALTAMVAFTLTSVERQSELRENPLLTANVEALSAAEMIAPDIIQLSDGTFLYREQFNVFDTKGNPMNICTPKPNHACIISSGYRANGKTDWVALLKGTLSNFHWDIDFNQILRVVKSLFK